MAWTEGTVLGEDTRLVAQIVGGDGRALWRAHDAENDRDVVVEVAQPATDHPGRNLLAFHADAEAAISLRHPSLLDVYDHGLSEDGSPYVIRAPAPGRDLAQEVDDNGAIGLRRGGRLVERLLRVLDLIHPRGLAKGGVTPDNVFLGGDGADDVKLWVQLVTTTPSAKAREHGCVAPERLVDSSDEIDLRASLWEVAALAYFALTGRAPFAAEGRSDRVQAGSFPRIALRGEGGEASRIELDGWFRRALAAQPADRFDSAREMLDAWQSVVGGLLLFVDADEAGAVTLVPAAGEDAEQTAMFDREGLFASEADDDDVTQFRDGTELHDALALSSLLDDEDEEQTAISVRAEDEADGVEGPSEPPAVEAPISAPVPKVTGTMQPPSSRRTDYPLIRSVPPPSRLGRAFSPLMLVAGIVVAALSSAATTWLSSADQPDCDCAAAPVAPECTPGSPEPKAAAAPRTVEPAAVASNVALPVAAELVASAASEPAMPPPLQPVWPSATQAPPVKAKPAPAVAAPSPDLDDPYAD